MGIIAVARYIFELSVWLFLFKLDRRYGLVYFNQLLDTQHRYFQAVRAQFEREVAMLKSFGAKEKELRETVMMKIKESSDEDEKEAALSSLSSIATEIDAEASRHFSLYAKDAQTNGYEFQAHLIQTKAIPRVERGLADIALERIGLIKPFLRTLKISYRVGGNGGRWQSWSGCVTSMTTSTPSQASCFTQHQPASRLIRRIWSFQKCKFF